MNESARYAEHRTANIKSLVSTTDRIGDLDIDVADNAGPRQNQMTRDWQPTEDIVGNVGLLGIIR